MAKLLLKIEIIPHADQCYPMSGDWTIDSNGSIRVLVSDTGSVETALLTGVHEAVEAILCRAHGVLEMDVCAFDIAHALEHGLEDAEPGADPKAPYFKEHAVADVVERLLAVSMGVPWCEHDAREDALFVGQVPVSCDTVERPVEDPTMFQRR